MYKSSVLAVAMLSWASVATASTQQVNLSPKAAHTLDFSSQGCTVEKAYFGDPRAAHNFEVSLDQPQPQTQKITLRWKTQDKADLKAAYLQLHLQGCAQKYAQISITPTDAVPPSPVTYINAPGVALNNPPQVAPGPSAASTAKAPVPKPKTIKRPPVRQIVALPPPPPRLAANPNRFRSSSQVTPSTLVRGLNQARSRGEISFNSDMHKRVNSMVRAMRSGSKPGAAGKQAGVPESVVQALIQYGQRR